MYSAGKLEQAQALPEGREARVRYRGRGAEVSRAYLLTVLRSPSRYSSSPRMPTTFSRSSISLNVMGDVSSTTVTIQDDGSEDDLSYVKLIDYGKKVRSRRPAVLRRLHAIDATRVHQTRSWVVYFSNLRPFGPRRVTGMLRAGEFGTSE